MSQVTAQLSKASGQYNNGVISFLLHGQDGNNLAATRVVTDSVHHHNVSLLAEISFPRNIQLCLWFRSAQAPCICV